MPLATASPALGVPPEEPRRRYPFPVALPVSPGAPVVVLEASALRNSQLYERFIACVPADRLEAWFGQCGSLAGAPAP